LDGLTAQTDETPRHRHADDVPLVARFLITLRQRQPGRTARLLS